MTHEPDTAPSLDGDGIEVRADPEGSRFEALVDGRHAGWAEYEDRDGRRFFTHTEVDRRYGGRGVGTALVDAALEATRQAGLAVVPRCSFVAAHLRAHPELADRLDR